MKAQKILRGILLVSFALIAGFILRGFSFTENKNIEIEPEAPQDFQPVAEKPIKFLSVSMPALMEKEFAGKDFKIGKILEKNNFYTRYYITYNSGNLKISGIMNLPKGAGPFPILVLNHGYIDPKIYTNGRGLKREQDYLAKKGYIVIHPDYRNHADSDKDEESETNLRLGYAEDVINLILAVQNSKLEFFDKENFGMLGHSMGGGVAETIMVAKPDLVKAVVLFAPVSSDAPENFKRWVLRRPEIAQKIIEKYGSPASSPEFWKNVSPRNFFEKIKVPILIHHGTADKDVPLEWSETTLKALQGLGKEANLYIYEGEPHEFTKAWQLVMQRTEAFFSKYLKAK